MLLSLSHASALDTCTKHDDMTLFYSILTAGDWFFHRAEKGMEVQKISKYDYKIDNRKITTFCPLQHLYNVAQRACGAKQIIWNEMGHFTVIHGSEAWDDFVLIQTFLLYYVNHVVLMLTSIFQGQLP